VLSDGNVSCWGSNSSGQLGTGLLTPGTSPSPVLAKGVSGAITVAAGQFHTCAISSSLECWGANGSGQVGDGNTQPNEPDPKGIGVSNPTLVAGGGSHTCAVGSNGLSCWGANFAGQLGLGANPGPIDPTKPIHVPLDGIVQRLALGGDHSCALLQDGRVLCWGLNDRGQTATGGAGVPVPQPTAIVDP
jgi:alpha-tubulin suppressor-like RCC1 family protein